MVKRSYCLFKVEEIQKRSIVVWTLLFLIIVLAAIMRLPGLAAVSFSQDESTMLQFTRGLLDKGYPYLIRGGTEVPMATYELVPYFIAPFVKALGFTEYAARIPAFIFNIATLLLIYVASKRWFDYRVGLLAALMYAISPWSIYWSNNCFYPSQLQFFSMLSMLLIHRLFVSQELKNRDYYFLAAVLCATYLTWEGSGLLFLVYGLLGVIIFWRQWPFFLKGHAWLAFGLLVSAIAIQLLRRGSLQSTYLVTGSSRSSIATPQLAMNQPTFDPFYYIDNIFASEQHILLSVLILFGLVFIKQDRNLKFIYGYIFISLLVYTELLAFYAIRYMYFVLPIFLIATSVINIKLFDWVLRTNICSGVKTVRVVGLASTLIFIPFQLLVLSNDGVNLSELRERYKTSLAWELSPDIASIDYRHVMLELGKRYRGGDIIITRSPFLLEAYTGLRGDYMLQSVTKGVVNYNPKNASPYYIDKFVGNPVLRNRAELEDVLHRHTRVWFLATPLAPTIEVLGEDLFAFIHESMTLVTEGSNVRLYLWENQKNY